MEFIELRILGRTSAKIISLYKKSIGTKIKKNELLLFCSYSGFDIPVNYQFAIIENALTGNLLEEAIQLKVITQQFLQSWDEIPYGWKTICLFEFLSGTIPDMLLKLPVLDDWYGFDGSLLFVGKK